MAYPIRRARRAVITYELASIRTKALSRTELLEMACYTAVLSP